MNRLLFLASLALVAGCGTPEESFEDVIVSDDGKTDNVSSAKAALPDGAQHLYFGTPAGAYLDDSSPLGYFWFVANKGVEFKVGAAEVDGTNTPIAGQHVGFKLQRAVKSHGKWTWSVVAQGESDDGATALVYTPKSGPGLYLVTATANAQPASLTVSVYCGGVGCATAQQPGDSCGGFVANKFRCDDGLLCSYELSAQCGAGDQGGTCQVRPQICPKFYRPTCGCDGHTYGNNCEAASAGTSVVRVGPCAVNVVGNWGQVASNGSHYDYTFAADGTFTAQQTPACAYATPRCYVKIAPTSGNYSVTTSTLSLSYTSAFRSGETADFAINAKGTHLTGSDFGRSLDLTRK